MKYVIDIDALKKCINLLPTSYSEFGCIYLNDVIKLIDAFPKDQFKE